MQSTSTWVCFFDTASIESRTKTWFRAPLQLTRCDVSRSSISIILFTALLLACSLLISCGGSSNRVLQSISVSPSVGQNSQVQFVATGKFSAPPLTVTPFAVNWSLPPAPLAATACSPVNCTWSITNQGLATCGTTPVSLTVTASAPRDPKLPLASTGVPVVSGTATLNCP